MFFNSYILKCRNRNLFRLNTLMVSVSFFTCKVSNKLYSVSVSHNDYIVSEVVSNDISDSKIISAITDYEAVFKYLNNQFEA